MHVWERPLVTERVATGVNYGAWRSVDPKINSYHLSLTNTRDALHHVKRVANKETKADAQCDKLATELSWQRLRWSTFSSFSEFFVKCRRFWPIPPAFGASVGVTPFEFYRNIRHQKTRESGLSCGVLHDLTFSHFSGTPTCDKQTDRPTHDYGIYRDSMASRGKTEASVLYISL